MTELTNPYVPLEFANSQLARFAVSLPQYVNDAKIGVNLPAVHILCKLGGIRHIRVATVNNGETSKSQPVIVGVSKSGEAIAGLNTIDTKVPTYTIDNQNHDDYIPFIGNNHPGRFVNTTVTINTSETNARISEDRKWSNGVRSSEAWGFHLNKAVKHGILKSGIHHLVLGFRKTDVINIAMQYCLMAFFEIQKGPTVEGAIGRFFTTGGILNIVNFAFAKKQGKEFRLSCVYGPQVDRAIALASLSAGLTLIKGVPDSGK